MEAIINRIYNMQHSNIVTPFNLVENSKLDNYKYVKYYKKEDTLIAEMECLCEDSVYRKFFYSFNLENALIEIISIDDKNQVEILFDREKEVDLLFQEYQIEKNINLCEDAV